MAKERLSKLQRQILEKIYNKPAQSKKGLKVCFGKDPLRQSLTNSERVVLHKSLNNMLRKGLIERLRGGYILTEACCDVLKANECHAGEKNISYKDYQQRLVKELIAIFGSLEKAREKYKVIRSVHPARWQHRRNFVLVKFIHEHCEMTHDPEDFIYMKKFHEKLNEWCKKKGFAIFKYEKLAINMKWELGFRNRRIDKRPKFAWIGIKWKIISDECS